MPTVSTPFGVTLGTPVLTTAEPPDHSVITSAPVGFGGQQVTVSGASIVTAAGFAYGVAGRYSEVFTSTHSLHLGGERFGWQRSSERSTTISGAGGTADGTVAAEFENAFPANAVAQTGGNAKVVLATDTPHANGSDALAASYLEGMLGTGLLITPCDHAWCGCSGCHSARRCVDGLRRWWSTGDFARPSSLRSRLCRLTTQVAWS